MGEGGQRGRHANGESAALERGRLRGQVICDDRMRKGKQRGGKRWRGREREREEAGEMCGMIDKNSETGKDERRQREMEGIFIRDEKGEERVFI